MRDGYFVNIAINDAIKLFLESRNKQDTILYDSFPVVVIRVLELIYGSLDILNPYYLKNKVAFVNNLEKYGMSQTDILLFLEEFLSFYNFSKKHQDKSYKIANPHFKQVILYLIDMFIWKKKSDTVSIELEEKFLELIYTTYTKDVYLISYGYLMGNYAKYFEKYYYSKINEMDVTREININETIHTDLNLEALNMMGVSLSNVSNMSESEAMKAKNSYYDYFEVDATSTLREKELKEKMEYYKMFGKKVSTGNGYVDILLLMSVIVTSFSVLFILLVNII